MNYMCKSGAFIIKYSTQIKVQIFIIKLSNRTHTKALMKTHKGSKTVCNSYSTHAATLVLHSFLCIANHAIRLKLVYHTRN